MLNRLLIQILTFFRIIKQVQEITQPKQEQCKQEETVDQESDLPAPLFDALDALFAIEGLGLTKQNSFVYSHENSELADLDIRHILAHELIQGNIAKEALQNEALAKLMGYKTGKSVVQQVVRLANSLKG